MRVVIDAIGYAAKSASSALKPMRFQREAPGAHEIAIDVLFCGVCHSDIHQVENDWGNTVYPCLPGHEIVGRVARAGAAVTRHAVGDLVGVGCMIDSCRQCAACQGHEEQYCEGPNSWLATYNGPMTPAAKAPGGGNMYGRDNTFGGYSSMVVVPEDFALRIPAALAPEKAAPILCAGATTWSPMQHWGVRAGSRVGVIGFGGLGNMAAKLARGLGADVTVFTTTKEKIGEAEARGAQAVLESDRAALAALAKRFDFMLSTVPERHKLDAFIPLLKRNGVLVAVGALTEQPGYDNMAMIMGRRTLAGSLIGSLAETQAVLDFCAEHNIAPDVQVIPIQEVNQAYKHVKRGEVRFRYVIDMKSLAQEK